MRSIFQLLNVDLPVPDHSTLSKRGKGLKVNLPKKPAQSLNIVMDSTGLKIYGEGEWKVRMHGVSKRRTWRKLHVGANPDDGEIQAVLLTENSVSDDQAVAELLNQIEQTILDFAADGAYDKRKVYDSLNAHSPDVTILIPPRKNARIWKHGNSKAERLKRDENLRAIRKDGRKDWKANSGYHVRSLAETIMFRLKTIFGDGLSARLLATQTTQALIRCAALNKMTHLGMPQSYKVASSVVTPAITSLRIRIRTTHHARSTSIESYTDCESSRSFPHTSGRRWHRPWLAAAPMSASSP